MFLNTLFSRLDRDISKVERDRRFTDFKLRLLKINCENCFAQGKLCRNAGRNNCTDSMMVSYAKLAGIKLKED